jgi:hypothetical protein
MSTLTPPNVSTLPQLMMIRIRITLATAQQKCTNNLNVKLPHKAAHKRATSLYASEHSNPVGEKKMSASEFSKLVLGGLGLKFQGIQFSMKGQRIESV